MNVTPSIYPSTYEVNPVPVSGYVGDQIRFSKSLYELNLDGALPLGTRMDDSNCYAGFDPTIEGIYSGANAYGLYTVGPATDLYPADPPAFEAAIKKVTTERKTISTQTNYRLMLDMKQSTSTPLNAPYMVAWTNLLGDNSSRPWDPTTLTLPNTYTTYTEFNEAYQATKQYRLNPNYHAYSIFNLHPITEINIDQIVIYPIFSFITINFIDAANGRYYEEGEREDYSYEQIKPEDKTPAGEFYDEELWEKGYKDIYDQNRNIIARKICIGVNIDTSYGKADRAANHLTATNLNSSYWGDTTLPGADTFATFCVMAETYVPERDAIIYSLPAGVTFENTTIGQGNRNPFADYYTNGNYLNPNTKPDLNSNFSPAIDGTNPMQGIMCGVNQTDSAYTYLSQKGWMGDSFDLNQNPVSGLSIQLSDNGSFTYFAKYSQGVYAFNDYAVYPIKELVSTIASFGIFVAANSTVFNNQDLSNRNNLPNTMYHGNIDENGITDGTLIQGSSIADIPDWEDIDYDPIDPENPPEPPEPPGGEPDEGDRGDSVPALTTGHGKMPMINLARFTSTGIKELISTLWDSPDSFFKQISVALGENFWSYFISLKHYPLDISKADISEDPENILVLGRGGKIQVASGFREIYPEQGYNFGSITIKRQYKNFLDYAPYTSISIFLPFAGTFELNPTIVMGKSLSLGLIIDFTTGSGTWLVYNNTDHQQVLIKQCQIGGDYPLTGVDASQMASNQVNASLRNVQHTISAVGQGAAMVGALATGVGAVEGVGLATSAAQLGVQGLSDAYNKAMASKEIPQYSGGASGLGAQVVNHTPYIVYRRPLCTNPDNYAHTVGYLINQTAQISSLNGFTTCRNVDVSGIAQATDKEKAQIKQIMESGFYA